MATSSIFANIELKDKKRVSAFVDALCSEGHWPQPRSKVKEKTLTDNEWNDLFARSPYGKKTHTR